MDNFHIDITSEGPLIKAMEIAFGKYRTAEAYAIDPGKGLVFLWAKKDTLGAVRVDLPFKMDAAGAADFDTRWLAEADYGRQPDHDGDNEKGWRLYNEGWGRINGYDYSIVAVKPAWAMYGK